MYTTSKSLAKDVNGQNFIPVDCIATFAKDGGMKPLYFSYENKENEIFTYQIASIESEKVCSTFVEYLCKVEVEGIMKQIHLAYKTDQLRFVIIKDPSRCIM